MKKKQLSNSLEIYDSSQRYFKTEKYDFLERAYINPNQWALVVQHLFFNIFKENYDNARNKVSVFSRTIDSIHKVFNKTYFLEKKISSEEFKFLENIYNKEKSHFKYDILIFFIADFEILWQRLKLKNNTNTLLSKQIFKIQYLSYIELLDQYLNSDRINKIFIINTSNYICAQENDIEETGSLTNEEKEMVSNKLKSYSYSEPEEILSYLESSGVPSDTII